MLASLPHLLKKDGFFLFRFRSIRRPGSDTKRREMTGSGIFGSESEIDGVDSLNGVVSTPDRPSVRVNQVFK